MDVIIGAYYLLKFLNLETAGIAMRNSHLTTTLYDFVRTCMNDRYDMRSWIYVLWAYVLPYDFFGGALGLETRRRWRLAMHGSRWMGKIIVDVYDVYSLMRHIEMSKS
jgi:hypothetical protein